MDKLWTELLNIIHKSNRKIEVLNGDNDMGKQECILMNIPDNTLLYSIVSNSKGVIVDHWIRLLGHDEKGVWGVKQFNSESSYSQYFEGLFIVSDDIVGGIYAININRFKNDQNKVWYFAPDTLQWECLNMKYSEFVVWTMQGNVDDYYATMRWKNWKYDCDGVPTNKAILVYPFLWSKECDLETSQKSVVPLDEIIHLNFHYSELMNNQS